MPPRPAPPGRAGDGDVTNLNFDLYDALRHANVDDELARRASTRDLDDGAIRREFGTVK